MDKDNLSIKKYLLKLGFQPNLKGYHFIAYLIEMAKNTWDYFEDYMNEENNFMPPDNLQDKRSNLIVNRTSSTNIGLRFVSNNFCQRSGIHKRKRNDRKAF